MANAYITIAELGQRIDYRTIAQLSNDANQRQANEERIQAVLDDEAGELDGILGGMYTLPLPSIPTVLKKYLTIKFIERMYARRTDKPKSLAEDVKWCDEFVEKLHNHRINLVASNVVIDRAVQPVLSSSEFIDGVSRFDAIPNFDGLPSPTSPGRGEFP